MRWCFTLNNPAAWRPVFKPEHMAYLVYQLERGENGTLHVQGYVRFHNRKRIQTVKNVLDSQGVHLEFARGAEEQNKHYCSRRRLVWRVHGSSGSTTRMLVSRAIVRIWILSPRRLGLGLRCK